MISKEKEWFLSLPEETKLKFIADMLEEGMFGSALATSRILLDATIFGGGVSTEKVNEVFEKYNKKQNI